MCIFCLCRLCVMFLLVRGFSYHKSMARVDGYQAVTRGRYQQQMSKTYGICVYCRKNEPHQCLLSVSNQKGYLMHDMFENWLIIRNHCLQCIWKKWPMTTASSFSLVLIQRGHGNRSIRHNGQNPILFTRVGQSCLWHQVEHGWHIFWWTPNLIFHYKL